MKNSMDFSKIEVNGKLLGVLNFNLMIPISDEQLLLADTAIFGRDRKASNITRNYVLRSWNGVRKIVK